MNFLKIELILNQLFLNTSFFDGFELFSGDRTYCAMMRYSNET
jgi:hypothetical protein